VSGGTGYLGVAVISSLLERGHSVKALARSGSQRKLPEHVEIVLGNALDAATFSCAGCDTFIHLVGTPHPAPWKGAEFRAVDLPSLQASVKAAIAGGISHFLFLSVAQPGPIMQAYISVRQQCEAIIRNAGLTATIFRPWYVLGPGHRWPAALLPIYWIANKIPTLRAGSRRLQLVTLHQMTTAMVWAVDNPPLQTRVLDASKIATFDRV
jgi:uncharacterized protein YbjT (DUF2867 family)